MEQLLSVTDVRDILTPYTGEPPRSALFEYVRSFKNEASHSSTASMGSEDSWDSGFTHSNRNSILGDADVSSPAVEDVETYNLIYKLCRSLFKKAVQRTQGRTGKPRHQEVAVNTKTEKNMARMSAWMPLLHLFEPKTFFAVQGQTALHSSGATLALETGIVNNPREASQLFLDELYVEKLSGGNSNHVYRLAHPSFPDKPVLLRVYGNNKSDAIDRYRDVMAQKLMSNAELSPAVLHTFHWGRVEEFMADVATCSTDMLLQSPTLLPEIYAILRKMHNLPHESFLPENVNGQKYAALLDLRNGEQYRNPEEYCDLYTERMACVLSASKNEYFRTGTEDKLLEELCPSSFERTALRFLRLSSNLIKAQFRESFVSFICGEVAQLRLLLVGRGAPITLSHNDLNPGNILLAQRKVPRELRETTDGCSVSEEDDTVYPSVASSQSTFLSRKFVSKNGEAKNLVDTKGITFIDFEYCDANYRCYDIGNTICELDYDYTRGNGEGEPGFIKYLYTFPPSEYEEEWKDLPATYPRLPELIFRSWQQSQEAGKATGGGGASPEHAKYTIGSTCLRALHTYYFPSSSKIDADVACEAQLTLDHFIEVFIGMLSSHLSWSLWSFVLGCNPDECTNNTEDGDAFAKGSSGLDYVYYGNCRLKEYLALKHWMQERHLI